MSLPNTVAGTIAQFEDSAGILESFAAADGVRVLDVDGGQAEFIDGPATITGRASTVIEESQPHVLVTGTSIEIAREQFEERIGTSFAVRGRTAYAESCIEEGGGTFPFTLLSAVANVKCEHLHFDTESVRRAWKADGTLSDTWLAGSKEGDGNSTVMAYGAASSDAPSDIGLGFERAWDGYILRGVVFQSGYVSVYEDLGSNAFLRFVTEELVPHGYYESDDDTEQTTLGGDA